MSYDRRYAMVVLSGDETGVNLHLLRPTDQSQLLLAYLRTDHPNIVKAWTTFVVTQIIDEAERQGFNLEVQITFKLNSPIAEKVLELLESDAQFNNLTLQ